MASGFGITCANKNAHGVIVRIGGEGWSLGLHEAIVGLGLDEIRLYVSVGNDTFDIGVRGDGSDSYLVLEPSGQPLHELDGLPSCG